jgi:predicted metal-dependent hydrolase
MQPQAFWQGVSEFNQHQFYACHDTLEALWMEASDADKNFYQGILQIAVACYHLGNLNGRGAVMLLGEGIRRLSSYQPTYEGIDVAQLVTDSQRLLQALQQHPLDNLADLVEALGIGQLRKSTSHQPHPPSALRLPKIVKVAS